MIAKFAIEESVPYLKTSDKVDFALDLLEEYKLEHLPVVEKRKLIGIVSEEQLMDSQFDKTLGDFEFPLQPISIHADMHIFDAMKIGYESTSSILPVVNEKQEYIGMITPKSLLNQISQFSISNEQGGIFVLEMERIQYSLAEIARLVESNRASILSIVTTSIEDTTDKIQATVKVNTLDLTYILATLDRHSYNITHVFHQAEQIDELKERYDSLMHYLNV